MSIESQILALAAEADPLRVLPEDDSAKEPLNGIITEINRLRAVQAQPGFVDSDDVVVPVKRKPGRPPKGEGSDA